MKILILNYEFPPLGGGAGNATQNIAKELVKLGHTVTVVTTWFKDLPDDEMRDGYRLVRLHAKRSRKDRSNTVEMFSYVFKAISYCSVLLKKDKPDHIISFFALPTGIVAYRLNQKFGVPYTLSLRGGDVPGFLPKDLGRLHMLTAPFTKVIWRNAAHIVANSIGLQELASKTAEPLGKKVLCIPNGVDTNIFTPGKLPLGRFEILFVGRLTEQKGVTHILKALSEMRAKYPEMFSNIHATIIGDGPLRDSLQSEARSLGISEHVSFMGWTDREKLPDLYRKSSVFILPTFEEGMPNVILEAMASGVPVIATDVPGNNELIQNGRNGILIRDTAKLAEAILELAHDKEKAARYGREARNSALERGWQAIAAEYAKVCS